MLWRKFGLSAEFFIYFYFTSNLIIITFIDMEHQIIPDVLSIQGMILGILFSFLTAHPGWINSILGMLLGGGTLYLVAWGYQLAAKKEGMGGGDIKLLAMIGAFLGWKAVPLVIFLSAGVGSVIGLSLILMQKGTRHTAVPYGPFLALAAVISLLYGTALTNWYLNLMAG